MKNTLFTLLFLFQSALAGYAAQSCGFTDASAFGFSPQASGIKNTEALQKAVANGGTVTVSRPGVYPVAGTVYLKSNTTLIFGNQVFLKKTNEKGAFTHVFLNEGALTQQYDSHITINGLRIMVNGVDKIMDEVYGLRGQLAFFYIKHLKIIRFRCTDLEKAQFCIHICTFEDVTIEDAVIQGKKDGIHLGRGKRFTIRNCIFDTYDDAIGLNGQDYANSNPEIGWIEDGLIENCFDTGNNAHVGNFCRMLAGSWTDWHEGMEVRHSDAVVSNGRIYRVRGIPDGTIYKSVTRPVHEAGERRLDGIDWGVAQADTSHTAGVRRITFSRIFLEKARTGFAIHFDRNKFSRSYYPGAQVPVQEQLVFENIRVRHRSKKDLMAIRTPVDALTLYASTIGNTKIAFYENEPVKDDSKTQINFIGCTFTQEGMFDLVENRKKNKRISIRTSSSIVIPDHFQARIIPDEGVINVQSDLPGLSK